VDGDRDAEVVTRERDEARAKCMELEGLLTDLDAELSRHVEVVEAARRALALYEDEGACSDVLMASIRYKVDALDAEGAVTSRRGDGT
jgi:hypothetical protein